MSSSLVSSNITIKVSDGVGFTGTSSSNTYTVPANSYVVLTGFGVTSYSSGTITVKISGFGQTISHTVFSATSVTSSTSGEIFVGPDETIIIANSAGVGQSTHYWFGVLFANTP